MKNMLKRIQDSKGFVSLEVIMIAGIIVVLGASIMLVFKGNAQTLVGTASTQLTQANTAMNP